MRDSYARVIQYLFTHLLCCYLGVVRFTLGINAALGLLDIYATYLLSRMLFGGNV